MRVLLVIRVVRASKWSLPLIKHEIGDTYIYMLEVLVKWLNLSYPNSLIFWNNR